jgi:hypothetical protein
MTTKRKAHTRGMRMLNVRIDSAQIERLREVAAADHRTVSQELRRLIEERIAEAGETVEPAEAA